MKMSKTASALKKYYNNHSSLIKVLICLAISSVTVVKLPLLLQYQVVP